MSLVIAYLWTAVVSVANYNPRVDVRFYVDDAQLQYVGTPGDAVGCLYQAATDLFDQLEGPLALKINRSKTMAVGSKPAPVVSLCRLLGIDTSAAAGAVRNLGSVFPCSGSAARPWPWQCASSGSRASSGVQNG